MKYVQLMVVFIVIFSLINWSRAGEDWPIVHGLPFLGGHEPGLWDFIGLIMLGMTAWGLMRLSRQKKPRWEDQWIRSADYPEEEGPMD